MPPLKPDIFRWCQMVVRRGRGHHRGPICPTLPLRTRRLKFPSTSQNWTVVLQVLRFIREEVIFVDVILVIVLVPLRDILFIILVIFFLCLISTFLTSVVVVVRVSRVWPTASLRPKEQISTESHSLTHAFSPSRRPTGDVTLTWCWRCWGWIGWMPDLMQVPDCC